MGTVSFPSEEERQQTQSNAGLQWEITVADHSRGTHDAMLRGQSSTTVEKWINVVCPQTERKESAKISWAPRYWLALTLKSCDFFEPNLHTCTGLSPWLFQYFLRNSYKVLLCQLVSNRYMNCLHKYYLKSPKCYYPLLQHQLGFAEQTRYVLISNRLFGVLVYSESEISVSHLAKHTNSK